MEYQEHIIEVEAKAKIFQELTPQDDEYFEVTKEQVLRRSTCLSAECACGKSFSDVRQAQEHVERIEWIQEEWEDVEPLDVGKTYANPDDVSQSVTIKQRTKSRWGWELKVRFHGMNNDDEMLVPEKDFTESVRNDAW